MDQNYTNPDHERSESMLHTHSRKTEHHGFYFISFVGIALVSLLIIIVIKFIRDSRGRRSDQLRTVNYPEEDFANDAIFVRYSTRNIVSITCAFPFD